MNLLRHLLIENGPYAPGHTEPFGGRALTADELNELRNELLDLLILRSTVEDQQRFTAQGTRDGGEIDLTHNCGNWTEWITSEITLAELNRRATEHAEECR